MKKYVLATVVVLILSGSLSAIGSAIYWTQPTCSEGEAAVIARHDLAIMDMNNLFNNPDNLRRIKQINPELKLLCYVNPLEVWQEPMPPNTPFGTRIAKTISHKFPEWYLHKSDGQPVIYWQGMQTLNMSSLCPVIQGMNYSGYLKDILLENVLSDPVWDGLFLDNLFEKVSWLGSLDLNRDGREEDARTIDYSWFNGSRQFLSGIRQAKGKQFLIVGNHLSLFYGDITDGRLLEDFPTADYCWEEAMAISRQLPLAIFQAKGGQEKALQVFNSSLLLDNAYFCYGQNMAVSDSLLAVLSSLKRLPASQRGSLVDNNGVYQRQLGNGLIQVRLNRGQTEATEIVQYKQQQQPQQPEPVVKPSGGQIDVCIDLTPNKSSDSQKKFLVYELANNLGINLPNAVNNNLRLMPTARFSGDVGMDGQVCWIKASWLADYYQKIIGMPMPAGYQPGIRGDRIGWNNGSQLMNRQGDWFTISLKN